MREVRALFRKLIPKHQYLVFADLGWFGAWGRIGAEEARTMSKTYAVWLDWVIHEMPIERESSLLKRIWYRVVFELTKWSTLRDIKGAGLGLFNGSTVYQAYAPYSSVPKVVHDIHLVPLHRGFDCFKFNGGLGGPRARPESQCCARLPGVCLMRPARSRVITI